MSESRITDYPRTAAEADALPEVEMSMFVGLIPGGITGDGIILFVGKDGRSMMVVQTPDGPAKKEFR